MFLRFFIGACLGFLIFCNALLLQGEAKADASLDEFETYISNIAKIKVGDKKVSARWYMPVDIFTTIQTNPLLSNYLSRQLSALSHESKIKFNFVDKESNAHLIIKSVDQFDIAKSNHSFFQENQCYYSVIIQNETIQKAAIFFKKDSTNHQTINCLAKGLLYIMGAGDPERNGVVLFNSKLNPLSLNLELGKQDLFIIKYIYSEPTKKRQVIQNFYQADNDLKIVTPLKSLISDLIEHPSEEKIGALSSRAGKSLSYSYIAPNRLVWSSPLAQLLIQDIARNQIKIESLKNSSCDYCFFSFLTNYAEALSNNNISESKKIINFLIYSYDKIEDPILKPAILYYKASLNMDQAYGGNFLKEALNIAELYNGPDYPQVLNIRHRLAEWYLNNQEFAMAAQEISLNQKFYDGRYFSPVAEGQRFFDGALVFWKAGLHKEAKQNLSEARKRFVIGNYLEGIQKVNELEKLINL